MFWEGFSINLYAYETLNHCVKTCDGVKIIFIAPFQYAKEYSAKNRVTL
jgi:hypothetical protein